MLIPLRAPNLGDLFHSQLEDFVPQYFLVTVQIAHGPVNPFPAKPNVNMKHLCEGKHEVTYVTELQMAGCSVITGKHFKAEVLASNLRPIHSSNSAGTFLGTKGTAVNKQIRPLPNRPGSKT